MTAKTLTRISVALAVVAIGASSAEARRKPAPVEPLSEAGQKLEAAYAQQLEALKSDLTAALPKVSEAKKAAYAAARAAEVAAKAEVDAAQAQFGKLKQARGLVGHAKGKWIGGAKAGIAKATAKLK